MKKKTSTSLLLGLLATSLVAAPCYGSATQKRFQQHRIRSRKTRNS
ncbi:MAG: hypothetical protein ACLUB0_11940 [Blautia hansenii]